jgi:transmembrane sensor
MPKKISGADFVELLDRYHQEKCTRDEKVNLEEWLDGIGNEEGPFTSQESKVLLKTDLKAAIDKQIRKSLTKRRMWLRYPAAFFGLFIIMALLSYGVWYRITNISASIRITQSKDIIQKIVLPDHSVVWLKPHSALQYPNVFSGPQRNVTLTGEALFEVSKDPEHPFTIESGGVLTEVLGTSFNIKVTAHQTEIYVLTGRVSVTAQKTNESIDLMPNESVVYRADEQSFVKSNDGNDSIAHQYTAGTRFSLKFDRTKATEALRMIENKFDVTIQMPGDFNRCFVTADLTGESLENAMDILSETLNASYTRTGNMIKLEGDGCN